MRTAAHIVATRIWWRHTYLVSRAKTHRAFVARFGYYASGGNFGLKLDLLKAWEDGTHGVSRGTVRRVASKVHGTEHDFALADLLHPRYISAPGIERLMGNCLVADGPGSKRWVFPNDAELEQAGRLSPGQWDDPRPLVERGDFNGFLAILALFRRAKAQLKHGSPNMLLSELYHALPSALRLPWVQPDVDLLLQCIENVATNGPCWLVPAIDCDILRSLVLAPTYEPNPRFWVLDPATNQFVNQPQDLVIAQDLDFERVQDRPQPRPIPLLPDVMPLEDYLIRPKPPEHQRLKTKRLGIFPKFKPVSDESD